MDGSSGGEGCHNQKDGCDNIYTKRDVSYPYPAYGQVVAIDGQLSDEGVVYLILRHADGTDAQILSSAVNPNNGTFYFDLSNALSSDGEYLGR